MIGIGTIKSYKPFAVFFRPEPTELEILTHEREKLEKQYDIHENALERITTQIAYVNHKINFWTPSPRNFAIKENSNVFNVANSAVDSNF